MEKVSEDLLIIDKLVERARIVQQKYEATGSQKIFDTASQAVAWALMQPSNNKLLSELAVSETGLGNVEDKIKKKSQQNLRVNEGSKTAKDFWPFI